MEGQTTGSAIERRYDVTPPKSVARQLENLIAGRDVDFAVASGDDIVGARQRLANRKEPIEPFVRAQRPIHRRNGILF